jgi:hypothetical protein
MALNPTTLASAIKSALQADPQVGDNASLQTLCNAIAQAVVSHIVANAVVTVPPGVLVSVAVVGAAGTGATTAPGMGVIT